MKGSSFDSPSSIGAACVIPEMDGSGIDYRATDNYPMVGRLQMDMLVSAFACDVTRVASLQWDASVGGQTFPWLGITTGHMAKFVKRYADVHDQMVEAVGRYGKEVRTRHFPEPDHVYSVEPAELAEFRSYLDQGSLASQKTWDWEPLP